MEYVSNALNAPLYFVRGNHASQVEYTVAGPRTAPLGAIDLHRRIVQHDGLLLAGVEGSLRYRESPFQYSQGEMWGHVYRSDTVTKTRYHNTQVINTYGFLETAIEANPSGVAPLSFLKRKRQAFGATLWQGKLRTSLPPEPKENE
jgi:hypothetical protein